MCTKINAIGAAQDDIGVVPGQVERGLGKARSIRRGGLSVLWHRCEAEQGSEAG